MNATSKKYMVRCDMEGVTGVVSYAQVEPGRSEYPEARELLMQEILSLVEGLQSDGAEIVIYDEHWFGRNLQVDRLPPNCRAISGKPPYRPDWPGGLDETFSGLVLQGLHSKAGSGHLLHHTYEPDFAGIEINGVPVGEIGLEAAVAGDCNVPVLLVVADSAGTAEARELLPGVITVDTKQSKSAEGAVCLPLCVTTAAIKDAAKRVVDSPPVVRPLRFEAPVELACDFRDGPYLDALRRRAGERIASPNRLILKGASVTALWSEYWALKLLCQKDLYDSKNS